MAWDPDDEEIEEAVAEGNVEWLASVIKWYRDPEAGGKAADLQRRSRERKREQALERVLASAREVDGSNPNSIVELEQAVEAYKAVIEENGGWGE